ncbi:UNVERIFIED_CONTAM: Rop guanine nucleotide exchange factor 1 [Sesamum calycinum]|uniref:Rop guanine nucleotide exchange factor 1 n=1 Tax=Sesamum calycinum TaxID=2727403 RepID=A0AAW2PK52_9LAMI
MGSVSSEEGSEERCGSYSLSADVSESESSNGDVEDDEGGGASSSAGFSPFAAGSSAPLTPTFSFPVIGGKDVVVWDEKPQKRASDLSEIEMMKERFAKLLLGEDMSGGNCIWGTVEARANGSTKEGNVVQRDGMALISLKKLDAMLISILDGFRDTEFWYVDRGIVVDDCDKYSSGVLCGRPSVRQEEKWWLPCPKVPGKGLSEDSRKRLQQCRDCTNQILKAALAINSNVLAEMDIPTAYMETLPKNGRDCLGDIIYRYITADQFSPECLLDCLDLSSEHHTLDVANRIEAAVHVWKLKERKKHPNVQKSKRKSWGGKVKGFVADAEKNQFLAQRAETLLHSLRLRFPGLPQTALDMSKIQYNKDVGHAILESYSRVMESLAFNIIARIDDVFYVDDATKRCVAAESMTIFNRGGGFNGLPIQKKMSPSPFSIQHTPYTSPFATPTFCSSPPLPSSPRRSVTPLNKSGLTGVPNHKFDKVVPADLDKLWSYAGNLGSRRVPGDAPERD